MNSDLARYLVSGSRITPGMIDAMAGVVRSELAMRNPSTWKALERAGLARRTTLTSDGKQLGQAAIARDVRPLPAKEPLLRDSVR